jgi:hypothetical protein
VEVASAAVVLRAPKAVARVAVVEQAAAAEVAAERLQFPPDPRHGWPTENPT